MKANRIIKLLLLFCFLISSGLVKAQQQNKCLATKVDMKEYMKMVQIERSGKNFAPATPVVIRVFFRVCEPDGGKLFDITEDQINTDFKHLVGAYAADNICFINAGYDHIYSSALDTFNTSKNDYHIFLPYGIQNCLTIFYVDQLGGTNNASGGGSSGVTYGVGTAWTIVAKAYLGKGTLEHEVGHCFGLLHTFDFVNGNGLEDIDGSNGSTSADLIADTHADPYAYSYEDALPCYSGTNCTYTGSCTDPKGRSDFSPPYNNLMSYWCNGFYPNYTLTSGQFTRINTFLQNNSALLAIESPSIATDGPYSISSGYHMNSAVTTLTTSGSILINGTTNALLGAGQTVFLEPGFDAVPSTNGRVFVRHDFCDTISNGYTFTGASTSNNVSQISVETNTNKLTVFPNPTNGTVNVSFTLQNNESNVLLQLYNMSSQKVKQVELHNMPAGKQTISVDLHNSPSGVYYAMLVTGTKTFTAKIVLVK